MEFTSSSPPAREGKGPTGAPAPFPDGLRAAPGEFQTGALAWDILSKPAPGEGPTGAPAPFPDRSGAAPGEFQTGALAWDILSKPAPGGHNEIRLQGFAL